MKAPAELRSFSKIGNEALLMPPSRFLIVGDEVLVSGSVLKKVKTTTVVSISEKSKSAISLRQFQILFKQSEKLGTRSLADFTIPKSVLVRLKALAKELNSTHVRIFAHEERGIVARLFDVRIGSDVLLPRIERIHASATLNVRDDASNPFSLTLSVESLNLLPADDLLVSVYADGIMHAAPVNSGIQHVFVCRDQGISEPYTSFQHETLNRTVYFVAHPSG